LTRKAIYPLIKKETMKIGIIGFPKVGKTTLFNILTGAGLEISKFGGGKTEAKIGVAKVADKRLSRLSEIFSPKKLTPAEVTYVDIGGVSGAELGRDELISALRPADAFLHIVRAFYDPEIVHRGGEINPAKDIADLEEELILADLMVADKRLSRLEKDIKKIKDEELIKEGELLYRVKQALDKAIPLRELDFSGDEKTRLRGFQFLSAKPILEVINLGEEELGGEDFVSKYRLNLYKEKKGMALSHIYGKIELEIAELAPEEAREFRESYGIDSACRQRIIGDSYRLLGLISFFTYKSDEVRAFSIKEETTAVEAASAVHSDIKRGFIRAEVIAFSELDKLGSLDEAKKKGLLRLEGKDYLVSDGDVITFRFNI
jgi:GTP-binding protein YchF